MRNTSIFNGIKELNELTFISNGVAWDVFRDEGDAKIFIGKIRKIRRESNYALYNRALELHNQQSQDAFRGLQVFQA